MHPMTALPTPWFDGGPGLVVRKNRVPLRALRTMARCFFCDDPGTWRPSGKGHFNWLLLPY